MLKINFQRPLSTIEIRDPAFAACLEIAREFDLHATFHQPQQPALTGPAYQRGRKRIGNGKHKNWYIDFQPDEPHVSKPRVVGRIALKSPPIALRICNMEVLITENMASPRQNIALYQYIHLLSLAPLLCLKTPCPELLTMIYHGLEDVFVAPYPRLFDIDPYNTHPTIPQVGE